MSGNPSWEQPRCTDAPPGRCPSISIFSDVEGPTYAFKMASIRRNMLDRSRPVSAGVGPPGEFSADNCMSRNRGSCPAGFHREKFENGAWEIWCRNPMQEAGLMNIHKLIEVNSTDRLIGIWICLSEIEPPLLQNWNHLHWGVHRTQFWGTFMAARHCYVHNKLSSGLVWKWGCHGDAPKIIGESPAHFFCPENDDETREFDPPQHRRLFFQF